MHISATIRRSLAVACLVATAVAGHAAVTVDPKLPVYNVTSGVSGTIKSVGSDTMNNMMALWAEAFKQMYPNIQVEIEGKGSGTAIPALVSGTSIFGPMSRATKDKERDEFEKKFGFKPTQLPTSIDMLAVFVHRDNPIKGLSLKQIDGIFSKTYKSGSENIERWGQVGLTGEWANLPISLYGRNSASGTYGYFKKNAMKKGDYKDSVKEQPGSSAVVNGIAKTKGGIGYSGIGYKTADVRVVPLAASGTDYVEASADNVEDYPLSRHLYLTVNYEPGAELDTLRQEFIKYIFSQQGQSAVVSDGYLPIDAATARAALKAVGIEPGS
ncbi:MAG: PstS family phosphate ABC transporter substrate-binding protein [Planctomycetota bacterium]